VNRLDSTCTTTLVACAALSLLIFGGCWQRVDSDPPTAAAAGEYATEWELVDKFGGAAVISQQSADPWEQRFAPGGFVEIAGVCATGGEVWVCDLGISRVQAFDFGGQFLRSYGRGIPLEGTLPSDEDFLHEEEQFQADNTLVRWQKGAQGQEWVHNQRELFRAADVLPVADGFWLADWGRSSGVGHPERSANLAYVPFDAEEEVQTLPRDDLLWPAFIAKQGNGVAVAETFTNLLWLVNASSHDWTSKSLTDIPAFKTVMMARVYYRDRPRYLDALAFAIRSGHQAGKFNGVGGVAMAFDKLVACDRGNYRLQVFDADLNSLRHWGSIVRVIPGYSVKGQMRFAVPHDIDIMSDGTMLVLDAERLEVAVLSPTFDRIGCFGRGELVEPWALDLSDDGRHCFITDTRENLVYHYAASN